MGIPTVPLAAFIIGWILAESRAKATGYASKPPLAEQLQPLL